MPAGQLNKHLFNSQLLKNNRLGNNSKRELLVYTPPEFSKRENLQCIFFLPGFGGTLEKWQNKDFPMYKLMELLILNNSIPRSILCCIDGMTRFGGSQYIDSSLNGPFMKHIVKELVPFIIKKYNVLPQFYICGHSSGGFGALQIASLYPELFTKTASFAGDMYFELTHKNMLCDFFKLFNDNKLGSSLKESLKLKITDYIFGLSAAYTPNLRNKKWLMDFPIDLKSGELNEKIWAEWKKYDPIEWVSDRSENLKKLKLIYLSAGTEDQFSLQLGAKVFSERCNKKGISTICQYHEGNHSLLTRQAEAGIKEFFRN